MLKLVQIACSLVLFSSFQLGSSSFSRDLRGRYDVRTCTMHLIADHKLYQEFYENEGNSDPERTREKIINMFNTNVEAVNEIYNNTDFNGVRGINLAVKRITIHTPDECTKEYRTENPFCQEHVTASSFLDLHSRQNHSAFCLSYAFTFRDFEGAELGLAWTAAQKKTGGVCHSHQKVNAGSDGYRSLNTGIVTLSHKGRRMTPRVAQLTLAHEIGHNFGAAHDSPAHCYEDERQHGGNFLMHASSSSGDEPNNSKFSQCSIRNISVELDGILRLNPRAPVLGSRRNCFTDITASFCGDGILEEGEQCDCGFNEQDCQRNGDKCCHARENQRRFKGCTRKPGAACSPSEGVCCNADNCQFHLSGKEKECAKETECAYASTCTGFSAQCPAPIPKKDGSPCEDSTKVCKQGTCSGSVCEQIGLKDCVLTENSQCYLACEKNGVCISSRDLPEFADNRTIFLQRDRFGEPGIRFPPGSSCNDGKGKCNESLECRSINENRVISWLKTVWQNSLQAISNFRALLFS